MDRMTSIRASQSLAGRFRGGKLQPVMAVPFKGGEGGMLSQTAILELDPIAGRLLTPITAQMMAVYVPVQAIAALKNPTDPNAGITEVLRMQGMEGQPLFGLEPEGEISKLCGVMPISIGGVKQVCEITRLAHNAAVNFLRKSLYPYAAEVAAANSGVTPALLSSTVLSRFNAVLDPDDHVNGTVQLDVQQSKVMPVYGMGTVKTLTNNAATQVILESGQPNNGGVSRTGWTNAIQDDAGVPAPEARMFIEANANGTLPNIRAELNGIVEGAFSLTDLYNAEVMDRLTRQMRKVVDDNPVDGEEQLVRWAYGLQVDKMQVPFLVNGQETIFGQDLMRAMDGAGIEGEVTQSRMAQRLRFSAPIPRTELGGVVITFLCVKPDEVLFEQPHPVLSQPWVFDNLLAEELQNDPMPVLAREVQAGVTAGNENNVVFYTGYNELRRVYVNYGWNRAVDPLTIDAKNAMWLYEVPASVTPENIIYPNDIPHYPFLDQDADIVRYQIVSVLNGMSPIYIGPSPVETVAVIDSENLFGDEDAPNVELHGN